MDPDPLFSCGSDPVNLYQDPQYWFKVQILGFKSVFFRIHYVPVPDPVFSVGSDPVNLYPDPQTWF